MDSDGYLTFHLKDMDLTCDTYPADDSVDPKAYLNAVKTYKPGDLAIIFTPDDTHYDIALACINQGMHVMVTKPIVQTLEHHNSLIKAAKEKNVLVTMEVHKRWDPFYADARDRARSQLGNFQYMYAYMSQPKHQLDTFKAWAGKSSDISYYLNSHHIDFSEWTLEGIARPVRVTGTSSSGVAHSKGMKTEDSITLTGESPKCSHQTVCSHSLTTDVNSLLQYDVSPMGESERQDVRVRGVHFLVGSTEE